MYKRILLAYDGSDAGQKALLDCQDLANWSRAELFLVAVMPSAMSFVGHHTRAGIGKEPRGHTAHIAQALHRHPCALQRQTDALCGLLAHGEDATAGGFLAAQGPAQSDRLADTAELVAFAKT